MIKSNYTFSTKNGKEKAFINWCNCSVYNQAAECGSEFKKLYELVYRQMSSYIHGSAWSLRKQISYSRAHYDPAVVLNDVATIVRTILFVLLEWAKLLKLELGWELYDNLTNLPKKIDELDDKHFPSRQ